MNIIITILGCITLFLIIANIIGFVFLLKKCQTAYEKAKTANAIANMADDQADENERNIEKIEERLNTSGNNYIKEVGGSCD